MRYKPVGSERVARTHPVMPGGERLVGCLVMDQRHQLRQRYGKLSLGPSHPHQHIRFAHGFGHHPQHLDLLYDI